MPGSQAEVSYLECIKVHTLISLCHAKSHAETFAASFMWTLFLVGFPCRWQCSLTQSLKIRKMYLINLMSVVEFPVSSALWLFS